MKALVVPSYFTAVDKFSGVLKGMGNAVDRFAYKSERAIARSERVFNKLTPSLNDASRQLLSFASTAALVGGIISGISFSSRSLIEYQDAIAKFRTIVSDLTDNEFSAFQNKINDIAKDTKESSITVANSFEMIAGLDEKLAKSADTLGTVSKAAITLSQASKDELGKSASNLVGIMNQFSLEAKEADRVINVLAAGQAVGASSIIQTADAFTVFGAVAKDSNLTLEQSVALTEVLASKQIMGSEAGTALRGTLIKLKAAGLGYQSGLFNTRDALVELRGKLDKLTTAKEKDALMDKVFGTINATTGTILLNSINTYDEFTKSVTGTSEAQKAADINNNTLSKSLERLSNKWVNLITGSSKVSAGMDKFNSIVIFLTDNMETIITLGVSVLGFFLAWKALLIVSKVALIAYNIVYGITNALQKKSLFYTEGNVYAKYADLVATKLITAAQWAWNAAMSANPIALIIIAIVAMIYLIYQIIKHYDEWGASMTFLLGPLGAVINLVMAFVRNWDYIKESFSKGGILEGIKAIGAVLLDSMLYPLEQILNIAAKLTGWDWVGQAAGDLGKIRAFIGTSQNDPVVNQQTVETVNPDASRQESFSEIVKTTQNNIGLEINDKTGRAGVTKNTGGIPVNMSSTLAYQH